MADMIARLKVDSSEYDAKIQRAARGIQDLARACHNAGGVLNVLEDENREYIQSLGNMATVAQTTRGKIAELTSAFIDIKSVYNSLSDEEKNGEFGRELNRQLDIMKGRIQDGKREIQDISNELNGGGNGLSSALDVVAGKFGLNIGQLTKFGGALALAKGALDTVKGAIESTEATHDALARTISVTDNVTNQFLRSLATADFSNFINGLQSIIDKTIDAYNAMDEFESYAARFQPWQQAQEGEIQTKLMQARAAKAKGENDRAEKLNKEAKDLINQLAESTKAYGEKQTKGGFSTIRSLMGGVDISDLQIAWYADPRNWEQAKQKAQQFANTQERIKQLEKDISGYRRPGETEMGYSMRVGAAQNEKNRLEEMLRRDQSLKRAYTMQNLRDSGDSEQAQALKQAFSNIYGNKMAENRVESLMARADRMEGVLSRSALGGGGGKGGGTTKAEVQVVSGSIDEQTAKVQELQKAWRAAADDDSRQKIKAEIEEQQYLLDRMTGKENFDPANMRELTDLRGTTAWATSEQLTQGAGLTLPVTLDIQSPEEKLREEVARLQELLTNAFTDAEREALSKALKDKKGQLDNLTGKGGGNKSDVDGFKNFNDKFSQLNSGVGSIVSGIQQMGVEIPKELQSTLSVLQGISTIMTGVLAIITLMNAKQTVQTGMSFIPFFAHGGLVHAATGYMVPGNDHADRTLIAASSGELILNRAQQGVIASQLENGNGGGMRVVGEIQGEKIVLVANRFLKRSGQGELVTWK